LSPPPVGSSDGVNICSTFCGSNQVPKTPVALQLDVCVDVCQIQIKRHENRLPTTSKNNRIFFETKSTNG
jgi:hypothetical protein